MQLLKRILNNYKICVVNDKQYILKNPTVNILCDAQLVYEKTLQQTRFNGWLTLAQCEHILMRRGLWSPGQEIALQKMPDTIDNTKLNLYQNSFKEKDVKKIRRALRQIQRQHESMLVKKHQLDHYTWERHAQLCQCDFIIRATLFDCDNNLVGDNVDNKLVETVSDMLNKNQLNITQIRGLVRSSEWQGFWRIGKPNPFNIPVLELNTEQQMLIMYSQMYDSVYEHIERPSEKIIEDDDMLDGWFVMQKRKREEEMAERQIQGQLGGKHGNSAEIFLPVSSKDDIANVNSMNNPQAKMIKSQRGRQIQQQGVVKEGEFLDHKLEQRQRSNMMFKKQQQRG